jgi:hypothetical protein
VCCAVAVLTITQSVVDPGSFEYLQQHCGQVHTSVSITVVALQARTHAPTPHCTHPPTHRSTCSLQHDTTDGWCTHIHITCGNSKCDKRLQKCDSRSRTLVWQPQSGQQPLPWGRHRAERSPPPKDGSPKQLLTTSHRKSVSQSKAFCPGHRYKFETLLQYEGPVLVGFNNNVADLRTG